MTVRWSGKTGRRKIVQASCFSSLAAVEPAVAADGRLRRPPLNGTSFDGQTTWEVMVSEGSDGTTSQVGVRRGTAGRATCGSDQRLRRRSRQVGEAWCWQRWR
jgi:hypothetical protein